jgi:DNA-binding transcriptional ArsR family regulator
MGERMKYWTNKELERLEQVCKLPGCWRMHLPEFPGRTIDSLRHMAEEQGWKKVHSYPGRPPTSQVKVLKLLENGDMCRSEIAAELGVVECTVSEILHRLKLAGKVRIKKRLEGRGGAMVWALMSEVKPGGRYESAEKGMAKAQKRKLRAPKPPKPVAPRAPTVVHVHRDPLVEAFFGRAAA